MVVLRIIIGWCLAAALIVVPRLMDKKRKEKIASGEIPDTLKKMKKAVDFMRFNEEYDESDIVRFLRKCEDKALETFDNKQLIRFYSFALDNCAEVDLLDYYIDFLRGKFRAMTKKEKLSNSELNEIYGIYCLCGAFDRDDICKEIEEFAKSKDEYKILLDGINEQAEEDIENLKQKAQEPEY